MFSHTFNLWLNVPGFPPLWKCALVGYMLWKHPAPKMGLISSDELLEGVESESPSNAAHT